MDGIVLGYSLHDYKSELQVNDLVFVDEEFYNIYKIDKRYKKNVGEPDNLNMYFVKSHRNNMLMNYSREELSKANIAIFDLNKYYNEGKKIFLGHINNSMLRNIRCKYSLEHDIEYNKIDNIQTSDLIDLTISGETINKVFNDQYSDTYTQQYFI